MNDVVLVLVPIFGSIVFVWVLSRIIVSAADEGRQAREIGNGQLEFAPNTRNYVAAILFVAYLAYMGASVGFSNFSNVAGEIGLAFWLTIALILIVAFPASIVVSDEGLRQVYWLRKKSIAWTDVSKVEIDEKRNRVTIAGQRGAKIVFMRQLPDRVRLMAELEKHCADKLPAEAKQRMVAVTALALLPHL
jgi:Bacterial PH domain